MAAELETALSSHHHRLSAHGKLPAGGGGKIHRYLHHPVQEVFQRFLTRIKHIDSDMDAALHDLEIRHRQ